MSLNFRHSEFVIRAQNVSSQGSRQIRTKYFETLSNENGRSKIFHAFLPKGSTGSGFLNALVAWLRVSSPEQQEVN
jgi:hypothetical protein